MFGGLGVRVARQSLGVSSNTVLLLQELRGRRRKDRHVVHGTHGFHLRGGDEVR